MSEFVKILQFHYEIRQFSALEMNNKGVPIIGYTSSTVPKELIVAAGFYPTLVDANCTDFDSSNQYMEPVFDHRTKSIFNEILAGKWSFLKALIIPRTSEAEHKLFLYLKEVKRLTQNPNIPEIYFFDFLHTQNQLSEKYNFQQIIQLKKYLELLSGNQISNDLINESIERHNLIRKQINILSELRYQHLLTGKEALMLIGASFFMGFENYHSAIHEVIKEIKMRNPLSVTKQILVKGFCINHTDFHDSLEQNETLVVAEDDWWGSRAGGKMIDLTENPLLNILNKYFTDTPSPRVFPMEKSNQWLNNEILKGIDKVEYYLPADDDVLGWEIPQI